MIKIYFDGIELLDDGIIGLSQEYKIFENNFYLGATPCRSIHLEIEKDYFLFIPKVVQLIQDGENYATLHIDSCELVDNAFYKLELSDAMTLLNEKYDASSLIEAGTTTLGDIVNNICSKYEITLETANFYGSDKIITWYDSERSARTYIGYVAELNGGYAIINNNGNLEFKNFSNETDKEILVEDCEDIVIGDKHKITRVVYDIGTNKWEKGTENATKIKNGTQIETSDSSDNEVVNYKQYGYTKQDGTPTADAPVEIEVGRGKNLFNKDTITSSKIISPATGTTSTNASYGASDYIPVKANVDYYQSNTNAYYSALYDKDKNYVASAGTRKFTPTQDGYVRVSCLLTNIDIVQVEKGDKATSYLPYNTTESKSNSTNMFNAKAIKEPLIVVNEDGSEITMPVVSSGNGIYATGNNLSELAPSLKVGDVVTLYAIDSSNMNRYIYLGSPTASLWSFGHTKTITEDMLNSPVNLYGNRYIDGITEQVIISDFRMVLGTEEKPFEPYEESSIQHHLGDNFLADKDYIENGILNKNIGKVVLNGSENWLENSASKGLFQITLSNVYYNNTTINALSDKLIGTTGTIITTSNYYINNSVATYSNNRLFFRFDEFAENLDGLKAWLKENPVTVYYELATPEQIQLETTGELRTFEPNTIITNDLNSEMEVEYETQTKGDTLYVDNENVYIGKEEDIENIFNNINGFEFYSLSTQNAPDVNALVGETINFVLDDEVYSTINQINKTYNGDWLGGYEFNIESIEVQETEIIDNETNIKNIKSRLNRDEAQLEIVAENTKTLTDNYGDMYTKAEINELILNTESGLTNTFIRSGGNNIFRNTGLWFEVNNENNNYEFWLGKAKKEKNDKAVSKSSILLQAGTFEQDQEVANGFYSVSFKYKKLISLANVKVIINNVSYNLTSLEDTEFYTGEKDENDNYIINPLEVSSNHINIKFESDTNNSAIIYDLMVNAGSERVIWTQNENETTTDSVNISKGITITSSDLDVKFKANADGIRTLDNNDERLTEFTDKGMITKEAMIENKASIVGILRQRVGNQIWDSFVG